MTTDLRCEGFGVDSGGGRGHLSLVVRGKKIIGLSIRIAHGL